jgi:hypothetical protein
MHLTFITYATPGPFQGMADDMLRSCKVFDYDAVSISLPQKGEGRNFYGYAMMRCLEVIDEALCKGPIALVDADQRLVSPVPEDLWEGSWKVAAINRRGEKDMVRIYGVAQNYLSSIVFLRPDDHDFARIFMLDWTKRTYEFGRSPSGHALAQTRDHFYAQNQWKPNWFCDQASLNQMLQAMKDENPLSVKDLSKDLWSARKEGNGAILLHFKGAKGKGYNA